MLSGQQVQGINENMLETMIPKINSASTISHGKFSSQEINYDEMKNPNNHQKLQ